MNLLNVNKQALSQTYYIIENMLEINKNKIPLILKNNIYHYMDKEYIYDRKQELFIETKELLYAILYKYILDDKQKERTNEYLKFYDNKNEEQKIGKYEVKFKERTESSIDTNMELIKLNNKSFITRIIEKIRNLFIRN